MPATATRSASLGFWTVVALVVGNMVGSGIFLLPASLAPYRGFAMLGWIVSAAGSLALALVFARLARFHAAEGGPYAFTRMAFGDVAGFLVAWGYWISIWCGNAGIAIAFVGSLKPFLPGVVASPPATALLAAGAVWVLTAVNIRGVHTAGHVQVWTTALKVLPLAFIGLAGFAVLHPSHFALTTASPRAGLGQLATAATLTFWAFGGLESATIPTGSVHDPARTIPRATIVGTLATALLYIVCSAGVMNIMAPAALAASAAPFADAAGLICGQWANMLVAAGAAIACFGALNGWILVASQVARAVANDRLFPEVFARSGCYGTPAAGLLISSALTTALIVLNASRGLVDLFTFLILLGTLNALVPYAFCALAGLTVDTSTRRGAAPMPRGAMVIALLAFAYAMWAIAGAGADVVYWGFLLLLCGLPVYVWIVRRR